MNTPLRKFTIIALFFLHAICLANTPEEFEEKLTNTQRPLSEAEKARMLDQYKKADRAITTLTDEFRTLSNAIGDYNRTRKEDYWAIVLDELKDEESDYHAIIYSRLRIAEPELDTYLKFLREEGGYDEKLAIANRIRSAPPTPEVFEFLKSFIDDPEIGGFTRGVAVHSLNLLKEKEFALSGNSVEEGNLKIDLVTESPAAGEVLEVDAQSFQSSRQSQTDSKEPTGKDRFWIWLIIAALVGSVGAMVFRREKG